MTRDEMLKRFDYKCRRYFDDTYAKVFETKFDSRWNEYKSGMKWRMFIAMPINESIAFDDIKDAYIEIVKKHVYAQIPDSVKDQCHISHVSVKPKGPIKTSPAYERFRFNVGIKFDTL